MLKYGIDIVCIDDDPDDLEIFEEAIVMAGLPSKNVKKIRNDIELFQFFETHKIPLIFFLDGSVLCNHESNCLEAIKNQQHLTEVPVVILSTIGLDWKVNDMYRRGASLFLVKPSSLADLADLLKTIMAFNWHNLDLENIRDMYSEKHPYVRFPKTLLR